MPKYSPGAIPNEATPALRAYLNDELRRIAGALDITYHIERSGAAPARPQDGDIIYAIDPLATSLGSGEGFYGRENGAWVKL